MDYSRLLVLLVLALPLSFQKELPIIGAGGPSGGTNGFAHEYQIVISHTLFGSTLTNFSPVICANMTLGNGATCPTATQLKGSGSSGAVLNTVSFNGVTVCADCVLTSDVGCTVPLSYDVAVWATTTGQYEARFLLSSASSSVDTTVYLCLGKSSVTTYQGGSVGAAYDANTCAVLHLSDGSSLNLKDSSSKGADLTNHSMAAAAGQIDGAASNGGTNYANGTSACTFNGNPLTIEGWVLNTANSSSQSAEFSIGSTAGGGLPNEMYFGPRNSIITGNSGCVLQSTATVAAGSLATNVWVHFACTMSSGGSSGTMTLYKNGASVATSAYSVAFNGTNNVNLHGSGTQTPTTNGTLDELLTHNTNRAAAWLLSEYNMEAAPSTYETWTLLF
jgi:Concanavalin A-like lectin/glucanases superfamily